MNVFLSVRQVNECRSCARASCKLGCARAGTPDNLEASQNEEMALVELSHAEGEYVSETGINVICESNKWVIHSNL